MTDFVPSLPAWRQPRALAGAAVVLAIGITATMDATGFTNFSALPLALVMGLFWFLQKNPAAEIGYRLGTASSYALPFLYPLLVLPALGLMAFAGGDIAFGEVDVAKALANIALVTVVTFLVAMVTEEGFFRGWLWASLGRAGEGPGRVLLLTSVAFLLWHVPFATLAPGHELPLSSLPVFFGNVFLLGLAWGLMRLAGGSILVSSLAHGVWNGLVYVLFGISTKSGMLGIQATEVYGPETGVLGLLMNAAVTYFLWRRVMGKR